MKTKQIRLSLAVACVGLLPMLSYAQWKPIKPIKPIKPVKSFNWGGIYPHLERMTRRVPSLYTPTNILHYDARGYNPVLGYNTHTVAEVNPVKFQVAPQTQRAQLTPVVRNLEDVNLPQMTEGLYMWRLVNPKRILPADSRIVQHAQELLEAQLEWTRGKTMPVDELEELPNILFLQRLLDPAFTPKTYAQLAAETQVYPKHVTLNAHGIPVPTAQAEQARILDMYLMLSHPRMMGMFNVANEYIGGRKNAYTPFVQTPEEHQAAEQLLALRQAGVHIPQNPTPRQLLDIAYNQLESHNVPYHELLKNKNSFGNTFPNYIHTQLYTAVKKLLQETELSALRESTDLSHLIVLDAVMGGLNYAWENPSAVARVIDAFTKLCREIPATPENVAHLQLLHRSLLSSTGFWEQLPDSYMDYYEYETLTPEEVDALREEVRAFAKIDVTKLMQP